MPEVAQAFRSLRRSPWYSTTVIAVIALSMAMATTVFAIVDGVLFKPLPYERPDELYEISGGYSQELMAEVGRRGNTGGLRLSATDLRDLGEAVPTAELALFTGRVVAADVGDLRSWAPVTAQVGAGFLEVLGSRPLFGGFSPEDFETPFGATAPALLSYETWQGQFAGRTDVVGQTFEPRPGTTYRIVGVLRSGFLYPTASAQPNVLVPVVLRPDDQNDPARRRFAAIGRLTPDVPLDDYQARFAEVSQRARDALPTSRVNGGLGHWDVAKLTRLDSTLVIGQGRRLTIMFSAVAGLLLLGTLNVSGLVASRYVDRTQELSLRRAVGARARDIVRLVGVEMGLLVLAGAVLGVLATPPILAMTLRLLPSNQGLLKAPALDWRVAGFVVVVSAIAVVFVSLWPLVRSLRQQTMAPGASRTASTSTARSKRRQLLVAIQIAVGFVLVLGGALLVGSLVSVWRTDVGLSVDRLIIVDPEFSLGTGVTDEDVRAARDRLLDGIRAIPGVTAAGGAGIGLLRGGYPGGMWAADSYLVTEGLLEALDVRVVDGRTLSSGEVSSGAPVAVLSELMARTAFPDGPAVGRILETLDGSESFTVVGVVEDARLGSWDYAGMGEGQVYLPLTARPPRSLAIRTAPGAADVLALVLAVAERTPLVRIRAASFAEDLLDDTVRGRRLQAWLFGSFAAAALVIVGVGVLGLIAMVTARRTREIGIRMSLGAPRGVVATMVLREQLFAVVLGIAGGALIASWAVGIVERYLYEITTFDVRVWAITALVIGATAVVGALIPALRASRVNPVEALRTE